MQLEPEVVSALVKILGEVIDGPEPEAAWLLNAGDPGMLRALERLSATEASAAPPNGGASIAAHVDHVRYGLQLLNRWSKGENPFAGADWAASWKRTAVSEAEWAARREELRREAYAWREALKSPRDMSGFELTGVVGSLAHLAYHLGAIRQINRSIRGPSEEERAERNR
jgi:hypothetical protein